MKSKNVETLIQERENLRDLLEDMIAENSGIGFR